MSSGVVVPAAETPGPSRPFRACARLSAKSAMISTAPAISTPNGARTERRSRAARAHASIRRAVQLSCPLDATLGGAVGTERRVRMVRCSLKRRVARILYESGKFREIRTIKIIHHLGRNQSCGYRLAKATACEIAHVSESRTGKSEPELRRSANPTIPAPPRMTTSAPSLRA